MGLGDISQIVVLSSFALGGHNPDEIFNVPTAACGEGKRGWETGKRDIEEARIWGCLGRGVARELVRGKLHHRHQPLSAWRTTGGVCLLFPAMSRLGDQTSAWGRGWFFDFRKSIVKSDNRSTNRNDRETTTRSDPPRWFGTRVKARLQHTVRLLVSLGQFKFGSELLSILFRWLITEQLHEANASDGMSIQSLQRAD